MTASHGIITSYRQEEGYGFIWSDELQTDCFFHVRNYRGTDQPERGDMVTFRLTEGAKGPAARDIRLVETGRTRAPGTVGVTVWTGPGRSGEYGLATYREEKGDGAFIHRTALVDGTTDVIPSQLYAMDVAKTRDKYVGLNVRAVGRGLAELIERLAKDPTENTVVRMKAMEIFAEIEGRQQQFVEDVRRALHQAPIPPPSETQIELPGPIRITQKGEPSGRTVQIVKTVVVGGIVIVGIGALATVAGLLIGRERK